MCIFDALYAPYVLLYQCKIIYGFRVELSLMFGVDSLSGIFLLKP